MAKTVVGSFDSYDEARRVCDDLESNGFSRDDVSIVASNVRGDVSPSAPATMKDTGSGAATGAAAGGVLGGAAGLVAGLMGLAIPGIGPIIAAGPLAMALAGAGAGVLAGGLIGGLTDLGVPEEEAHYYAESVRRGGALVTVRADETRAERAAAIMRQHGAVDIERRAQSWRESGWTGYEPNASPYTADEIDQERARYRTTAGSATTTALDDWNRYDDDFRRHYNDTYATSGMGYDEYSPAYRHGYELGSGGRYTGRSWDDLEPEARRDWESRYPGRTWDRFKDAVRRGWERTSNAAEHAIPGDSDRDGR